jgi:hypothetical protein
MTEESRGRIKLVKRLRGSGREKNLKTKEEKTKT